MHQQDSVMQWGLSLGCPQPLTVCPVCQLGWSMACSESSQLAPGYQECTAAGEEVARWDEAQ